MKQENIRHFYQTYKVYHDIRMPQIFLLGLMQGFPWVLIGSTLSLWLREEGFSRSSIGLFGLVFSVYSINFLWAPLLDRIRIPFLSEGIGQRRAWILTMQFIIFIAMIALFILNPQVQLYWIAFCALMIALSSATQDISLDALRIDLIDKSENVKLTGAAAVMVAGWWTSYSLGGAVSLSLAAFYERAGVENFWQLVYISLTAFILLGSLLLLLVQDKLDEARRTQQQSYDKEYGARLMQLGIVFRPLNTVLAWLLGTVYAPLSSFFRTNGLWIAVTLLSFIFLFKMGEAFLGRMSILFYADIGYSKEEIAYYSKLIGWVTIVAFSILGGMINARFGLLPSVFLSGIAMALTNLIFSLMAFVGPEPWVFLTAVIADNFTTAVSTVTFVAFISRLCDRTFSATQYALMASLGTFGRNTIASLSGVTVDGIESWTVGTGMNLFNAGAENTAWALFFVLTTLMVIPSLLLLWFISRRLNDIFTASRTKLL